MAMDVEYADWVQHGGRIRVSAWAIVMNLACDRLLVEGIPERNSFYNFLGGGVKVGETLEQTLRREISEETDLSDYKADFLFLAENFFEIEERILHSLENYFLVITRQENITSRLHDVELKWLNLEEIAKIEIRPLVVRDCLFDGSYKQLKHIVIK